MKILFQYTRYNEDTANNNFQEASEAICSKKYSSKIKNIMKKKLLFISV